MYNDFEKTQSVDSFSPNENQSAPRGYTPGTNRYNGGYGSGYNNYPQNGSNYPDNNNNNSNTVIIAIIIVSIVIILALGGFVAFFLMNNNSDNKKESKKEPITTTVSVTENKVSDETEPATTAVINVVGSKESDACQMLNDAGIKYTLSRQYNDSVSEGYVISQSPTDGFIKNGEKVRVYISKGPETTSKPSTGQQYSDVPTYKPPVQSSYSGDSGYIISDSNSRYLSESEVRALSRSDMNYALNEIYARKGRLFKDSQLQSYFNSKSWYHGYIDPATFDNNLYTYLNNVEIANINTISKVQKQLGYK